MLAPSIGSSFCNDVVGGVSDSLYASCGWGPVELWNWSRTPLFSKMYSCAGRERESPQKGSAARVVCEDTLGSDRKASSPLTLL